MFKKAFFDQLLSDHDEYLAVRERVISETRGIQRDAKQAIFVLHRGDRRGAKVLLGRSERALKKLNAFLSKHQSFHHDGNVAAAREEFLEAAYFYAYKTGALDKGIPDVKPDFLDEWGALADFTGELVRDAVHAASSRDLATVKRHCAIADQVVGEMLRLRLAGKLRQKTDEARRNLQRLEQLVYELSR